MTSLEHDFNMRDISKVVLPLQIKPLNFFEVSDPYWELCLVKLHPFVISIEEKLYLLYLRFEERPLIFPFNFDSLIFNVIHRFKLPL